MDRPTIVFNASTAVAFNLTNSHTKSFANLKNAATFAVTLKIRATTLNL